MYQPVNYTSLTSDMGTPAELQTMINTCHAAGVRVYADVVTNQMAGGSGTAPNGATDGTSSWSSTSLTYPDFSSTDFHPACAITSNDYNGGSISIADASSPTAAADYTAALYPGGIGQYDVQNCELEGMPDIATENAATQAKIAAYMEMLLGMGIDGFRIDAAKHQQEFAMAQIFAAVNAVQPLTKENETPWVTQEVIVDGESNPRSQFFPNGAVQEFQFATLMMQALRGEYGASLSAIPTDMGKPGNWGGTWGFDASTNVQTLVDDWDTERNNGNSLNASDFVVGDPNDATTSYMYDLANIFMLASPYGEMAQVQSGYRFTDENAAPAGCTIPTGSSATVCTSAFVNNVAQVPASRTTPTSGWDFIHRWPDIANMVGFNIATHGTSMNTWTVGTNNQIAFSRAPSSAINANGSVTVGGALGFVALNNDTSSWSTTFATGLPAGTYCNVINGTLSGSSCTADVVVVDANGNATVTVPANGVPGQSAVPAIAIYVGQTEGVSTTAPAAPTHLQATAASSTAIDLTWTASNGATTYTVYRSTSATGTFSPVGTPSSPAYTDSGLTANTTYYYYVTATDTAGTSAASSTVSATTASASSYTAIYPTMDLRGSMNNWGTTPMTLVGTDTWQVMVTLTPYTGYQYKYDAYGNWSNSSSWGASTTTGVAALSPASSGNFKFTTGSGTNYNFTFNDSTLAYSVTPVATVLQSFTMKGPASSVLTVAGSSSATAVLSITPVNGFSAPVTFACVGLPADVACSFSPASVTPTSASPVTTTLTIAKTTSTTAFNGAGALYPVTVLAGIFCCIGFRRRKVIQGVLLLVVCLLVIIPLNGCSGDLIQPSTTIGVTATSGSIQQTTVFQLMVK
jgi:alpha-amylase